MEYINEVEKIIDRYKDGQENLDTEQLVGMLEAAIDGLKECDKDGAARNMYEMAGYFAR